MEICILETLPSLNPEAALAIATETSENNLRQDRLKLLQLRTEDCV